MMMQGSERVALPLKSVAGALLFSVILGPVGLLYATTWGGAVMILLFIAVIQQMFVVGAAKYLSTAILLWLVSCIWSVGAVNRYNSRVVKL
jgi:hypothetical protein